MSNNTLPTYYTALFNAVEQAIEELDRMNFGAARELLICGQQRAESLYLDHCEETSASSGAGENKI